VYEKGSHDARKKAGAETLIFAHRALLLSTNNDSMKKTKLGLLLMGSAFFLTSCGTNRVQPNYEGVLMDNYGRNGIEDFQLVTGAQGWLWMGQELYQVPMWEQKADPAGVAITARDAGQFVVDPTYSYEAIRGKGRDIVFNYKHVGLEGQEAMDNIEANILNPLIINAYREEARNFTTDSLMKNLSRFEANVENRLKVEFAGKYFTVKTLTSGLTPPESLVKAVEARNNAIMRAEQVSNELEVARMNLEKDKIEADANRIRTSGLSNANLQEKYIEMLRTTANKVIITDGKTPIMLNQ